MDDHPYTPRDENARLEPAARIDAGALRTGLGPVPPLRLELGSGSSPMTHDARVRLLAIVEELAEDMVTFARDLVRIPTVNPPGQAYRPCAELIADHLTDWGHQVRFVEAVGRPEHTDEHPRINVLGRLPGPDQGPCLHFNGHFDVVPAGEGWSVDPFAGEIRGGRLYGRGSADMKGGLAAAATAVEAVRRSGVPLAGAVEVSGTVDEETGGFAGVAHLARMGILDRDRTDWVIIPEPFGPDRICVGHRGVYWFRVTAHGRAAHGSMPYLGRNAIGDMAFLIERMRDELVPRIRERSTSMPVVPPESGVGTLNVNSIRGGQAGDTLQSPCVPDRCEAVFDRRYLAEEPLAEVRAEIQALVEAAAADGGRGPFEVAELLVVQPVRTPPDSPLIRSLEASVSAVLGKHATRVASPGTYDHKHVTGLADVAHCVAYGPGRLRQAHRPDEWCSIEDMVQAAQVMALTIVDLLGRD